MKTNDVNRLIDRLEWKETAILFIMDFYNVSREDCIDYYMDEVEAYMELLRKHNP